MLADFIRDFVDDFLAVPENNNLGPGTTGRAWDGFLLGFSSGADELYAFWKNHIGDFHWTPAEAFALGTAELARRRRRRQAGDASCRPEELTVVSLRPLPDRGDQGANSRQTKCPAEAWARARIFGQRCIRALQRAWPRPLRLKGYPAVAPALLPEAGERQSPALRQGLHLVGAPRGLHQRPRDIRVDRRTHHRARPGGALGLGGRPGADPAHPPPLHRPLRLLPLLRSWVVWRVRRPLPGGLGDEARPRQAGLRPASAAGHLGVRQPRVRLRRLRLWPVPDRRALRVGDPGAAAGRATRSSLLVRARRPARRHLAGC